MARKFYFCTEFKSLVIAGVCEFVNHEYDTSSLAVQSKIEQSQSFLSRIVTLLEAPEDTPEEEVQTWDITISDLSKMRKLELQETAQAMEIEHDPDATRPDLIALISAEIRRG